MNEIKKEEYFTNCFNKKNVNIFIIIIVIFIFLKEIPNKIYQIINQEFTSRQVNIAYDYCEGSGTGYIFKIKKKFNLTISPRIINHTNNPNQYWIFNHNKELDNNKIIILSNLKNKEQLKKILNDYKIIHNYKNDCLYLEKK